MIDLKQSKTLAIIVTYNPEINSLVNNIIAINIQINFLVVFDNGSKNIEEIKLNCENLNILLISNMQNIGLGAAYNTVFKKYIDSYDYFITFDQDTFILENTIHNLIKLFSSNDKVGITAPSFEKRHLKKKDVFSQETCVIQSCSIIKQSVLKDINFFNEWLFIDGVDFDFCLRAKKHGYTILKSNRILIQHSLGEKKKFFFFVFNKHDFKRNFYIGRNHKFITLKYFKDFKTFIIKKNIFFIFHILKLIFVEMDKKNVMSLFKGLSQKNILK
jgi:rhamnosyltransferase